MRALNKKSPLEDCQALTQISLLELVNALKVIEQRRSLKREENIEGALIVKHTSHTQASLEGVTRKPYSSKPKRNDQRWWKAKKLHNMLTLNENLPLWVVLLV